MTNSEIRDILQAKGCLYSEEDGGHFVGISGRHLSGYLNIDPALPDVNFIKALTKQLVEPFAKDNVQTVLVPAIGAIPLAAWGPHYLQELTGQTVQGIWADKIKPRGFVIERTGFAEALVKKRVLIIEDMVNQMFSVKELVRIAREHDAEVVGVAALSANRTASAEQMGVDRFVTASEFSYHAWEPADCELCAQHVPIVTDTALGHGAEFQADHPDYPGGYIAKPGATK